MEFKIVLRDFHEILEIYSTAVLKFKPERAGLTVTKKNMKFGVATKFF